MSGPNSSHTLSYPWRGHQKSYSSSTSQSTTPTLASPWVISKTTSPAGSDIARARRGGRGNSPTRITTSTFAPSFIRTVDQLPHVRPRSGTLDSKHGILPESSDSPLSGGDFSGKRYVWVKDPTVAFIKAEVMDSGGDGILIVRCEDGMVYMCI